MVDEIEVDETDLGDEGISPDGHKPGLLPSETVEDSFKHTQEVKAIEYLLEPGKNIYSLFMRSRFPSKRTEAYRLIASLSSIYARCEKHHDEEGKKRILLFIAGLVAEDDARIIKAVDAIIGERQEKMRAQGGFNNWVQQKAFGNKGVPSA